MLFWQQIAIVDADCWDWIGPIGAGGYGYFGASSRADLPQRAHRASWIIHFGPIPDDLHVLHHCDRPICVRPSHLFLGTEADNKRDMVSKQRQAVGEKQGNAKLTDDMVREARALWDAGGTTKTAIAHRFGVSIGHAAKIVDRQLWRHLP